MPFVNKTREEIKEYWRKWSRKHRKKNPIKPMLTVIRYRNKTLRKQKRKVKLSIAWAEKVYTGKCSLTSLDFVLGKNHKSGPYSPSIDRINNKKGYTENNCRVILNGINALKSSGTDTDMYIMAYALIKNLTEEQKDVIHNKWIKLMENKNA